MSGKAINLLVAGFAVSMAAQAIAADAIAFNIPAGRLDRAILIFSAQARLSIALADPALGRVRVKAVRGKSDSATALRAMLSGSGLAIDQIDARSFRIVKVNVPQPVRPAKPVRVKPATPTPPPAPEQTPAAPAPELIVTASKRETNLADFPGAVSIVTFDNRFGSTPGGRGTSAIVSRLPVISSTNLGPGRNKLFIRGVADSSFTGPTQATVGQYLGNARLNYNAPDPDLELYDIGRVEVLEGPQGTLYGAGTLGGVIRIVPNPADLNDFSGNLRVGGSATASGSDSYDLAATINAPIFKRRVGLRTVAYRSLDGGYINDARRGLKAINRTVTNGGRTSLRINPGNRWTIEINGARQDISSRDSQYSESDLPRRTRASAIAQPFDNDYTLAEIAVRKDWKIGSLVSSTSYISHALNTRFDATPPGVATPSLFRQNTSIMLFNHETHFSRKRAGGKGWLIGLSLLVDNEQQTRSLGTPPAANELPGVENIFVDAAAFGELTFDITRRLNASIGGRLAFSTVTSQPLALANTGADPLANSNSTPFLPHFALAWKPRDTILLYARYHEGFRVGGLSIASTGSLQAVAAFAPDSIATSEFGVRYKDPAHDRFSASATSSYTRWEDIQADLIDALGFSFSSNIGSGRILGLSASAVVKPIPDLKIETSAFLNGSALKQPAPGFERSRNNDLPNIARFGAALTATYAKAFGADLNLTLNGSARYVGRSNLGVGNRLDIRQGKYVDTGLDARLGYKGFGVTLNVTNIANIDANRFAFGNPFTVALRKQQTPLRPRTIRIGIDAAF